MRVRRELATECMAGFLMREGDKRPNYAELQFRARLWGRRLIWEKLHCQERQKHTETQRNCWRQRYRGACAERAGNWVRGWLSQVGERQKLLTAPNSSSGWDSGDPDLLGVKLDCQTAGRTQGWLSLRGACSDYHGTLRHRGLLGQDWWETNAVYSTLRLRPIQAEHRGFCMSCLIRVSPAQKFSRRKHSWSSQPIGLEVNSSQWNQQQ
jgi:hypothetical protein